MARVALQLFGGFVALLDGDKPVHLPARKASALLGFLAIHHGRAHHRARLCSMLWEDAGEKQARDSLRQTLSLIRRTFGKQTSVVVVSGEMLALAPDIHVDVARFEAMVGTGSEADLLEACSIVRGDLLEGLHIDSSSFNAWLAGERMRLHDLAVSAVLDTREPQSDRASGLARIAMAQRLLALDPSHEGLHRATMRLYASHGRLSDALRQYERCRHVLQTDLGVLPDVETEALVRDIRARRLARRTPAQHDQTPVIQDDRNLSGPPGEVLATRPSVLRPMTVLHLDLSVLYDQPWDGDVEAQDAVQSRMADLVDHAASDHGGCLHARLGLAHVCLFGLDKAHGDDAVRAARTALRLREQLAAMKLGRGETIQFRAGLAYGALLARDDGEPQGRFVAGKAIDEARNLAQAAKIGEVLVSEELGTSLGDSLELSQDPSRPALSVVRLSERWRTKPLLPFIGRRIELVQFERVLAATRATSSGSAMIIRGEPGVGKTRLMGEFARIAVAHGFSWHMAVVQDLPPGMAPDPMATLATSMLSTCMASRQVLASGWVNHPRQVFIDDLIGKARSHDPDSEFGGMTASEWDAGRKGALTELLHATCQSGPAIIVVENMHWVDHRTADDLSTLAGAMAGCGCVLVLTTRIPEAEGTLHGPETYPLPVTRLTLKLFSAQEAASFAENYPIANSELLKRVLDLSGGNPLFLDQLLRSADADISHMANIASTVLARLDALPGIDRRALDAASILDPVFDEETLRFMLGDPGYGVGSLVGHGLLRAAPGGVSFVHLVVQDIVRASLLTAQRRNWHRRAALWFRGKNPARHAAHLERASDPDAPAAYLVAAREEAAAHRLESALTMAERGWTIASDPDQRFEAAMVAADLWRQLGRTAQAIVRYTDAAQIALGDKAWVQAQIGIAASARMTGDDEFGMKTLADALERLDAMPQGDTADPCWLERARIAYYHGGFLFLRGQIDASADMQKVALEHATKSGEPDWIARSYGGGGDAEYMRGDMRSAVLSFRKALSFAVRSRLADAETTHRVALASARQFLGEMEEALSDATEARTKAASLQNLYVEMQALRLRADLLIEQDRLDDAQHDLERALLICAQLGNSRYKAALLTSLARVHLFRGHVEQAASDARRAQDAARVADLTLVGPNLYALKSRIDAELGEPLSALAEGHALLTSSWNAPNALWFERDAIDACLAAGQPDRAQDHATALALLGQRWDLPWASFFAARGQVLARLAIGEAMADLEQQLDDLRARAEAGYQQSLRALSAADQRRLQRANPSSAK